MVKTRLGRIINLAKLKEYSQLDSVVVTKAIAKLMKQHKFGVNTANHYREAARAWSRWMMQQRPMAHQCVGDDAKIKGDTTPTRKRAILSDEEFEKLLRCNEGRTRSPKSYWRAAVLAVSHRIANWAACPRAEQPQAHQLPSRCRAALRGGSLHNLANEERPIGYASSGFCRDVAAVARRAGPRSPPMDTEWLVVEQSCQHVPRRPRSGRYRSSARRCVDRLSFVQMLPSYAGDSQWQFEPSGDGHGPLIE